MKHLLEQERIECFYIVNSSGGLIYNSSDTNINNQMIFCSVIHNMYEMAVCINIFEPPSKKTPKLGLFNSLNDKMINNALKSMPTDDETHFKIIFISNEKVITTYRTISDLLFVFVGEIEIAHTTFILFYEHYVNNVVLDPFEHLEQPVSKHKFI